MTHLDNIYRCKSEAGAEKSAKKIAAGLTRYSQAGYTPMTFAEVLPKRINRHDEIEDTGIGDTFRRDYARYLVRAWIRRNRKMIIEAAYSVALRKIRGELHLSSRAAKHIILQRAKSEFFEYEGEF